ncbi:MAG: hypothetical protein PHV11_08290, partial [Candidatus Bipolaricaulis sp.]|nr:hypothetical protein [Candidatus Bipolaricaulis sp.]
MCQFISFFHNPKTGEIKVHDLNSHSNTSDALNLNLNYWREGHYLPNGKIIARVLSTDFQTEKQATFKIRENFPEFKDFFVWSLKQIGTEKQFSDSLDLSGLTNAEGLKPPQTVGGWLDLRDLTNAK